MRGAAPPAVRGLFALLGLRKQSKEPSRAQETPSVSASQEIVEIRVISPTLSPTRTSRAASLLWRDSADGTAMFSRKASGSVATGGLTADESKHDVGAAEGTTQPWRHGGLASITFRDARALRPPFRRRSSSIGL